MSPTSRLRIVALLCFLALTTMWSYSEAQTQSLPAQTKLVIGTHEVPPFVIKNTDGSWSGISIDLVRRIASELGMQAEIRELTIAKLVAADDPAIDVTASINVTVNTNNKFELSHTFYSTGLAIAVP